MATRVGADVELAGVEGAGGAVGVAALECPGNAIAATAEKAAAAASDATRVIRVIRPEARRPTSRMRPLRRFGERLTGEEVADIKRSVPPRRLKCV